MKIYLAGLPPATSKQALYGLLSRYMQVEDLQMEDSDHPRGASATITIQASNAEANWITRRLTGMYWQGYTLRAHVSLFSGK